MLNTYTTTSTASRISCDHCVVSRKKTRISFMISSRFSTPSGRSTRMMKPREDPAARPALRALLRLAEAGRVERAVEQRAEHDERGRGRPEHVDGEPVGLLAPSSPITLRCTHSDGRSGDVGVRSTATKSTSDLNFSGLASCSGRTSRNSSTMPAAAATATTLRMSRVRRAGKTFTSTSVIALPIDRRDHQERQEHGRREQPERPAAAVDPAVRREHRDRHERDHPARGDHGLDQLRAVEPQPVHGPRHEQVEILREEEARERRDDVRQQQDREEAHEHQAEQLPREQRPDLRDSAEVREQLVQQSEDERPEQRAR